MTKEPSEYDWELMRLNNLVIDLLETESELFDALTNDVINLQKRVYKLEKQVKEAQKQLRLPPSTKR